MASAASSASAPAAAASVSSLALPARPADALPVYLDYNATTPLRAEVVSAMSPFLQAGVGSTAFGNPSSSHVYGRSAKDALERARAQVALCLGASHPSEIMFTSGATESLNSALIGAAEAQRAAGRGNHIITAATEHIAVLEIVRFLEQVRGFEVTILPVGGDGVVDPQSVSDALRDNTCLVSLMLANNESGAVSDLASIARVVRRHPTAHGAWIHTDASQAVGKHPVSVDALGVDLLTVAGHKLFAPKGVGVLYMRASTVSAAGGLAKVIHGANHESNRRAGTENVLLAVALGAACEAARLGGAEDIEKLRVMRDALQSSIESNLERLKAEHGLKAAAAAESTVAASASAESASPATPSFPLYSCRVHGSTSHRLANTLSIGFHRIPASILLDRLQNHVAASAGAACHSPLPGAAHLSYVLQAMRVPVEYGMGTLRLSVGRFNTVDEVTQAGLWIAQAVVQMWIEQRDTSYGAVEPNVTAASAHAH